MNKLPWLLSLGALIVASTGGLVQAQGDEGPLVRALWLVQRCGTGEAADPRNDQRTKGALFKALGKDGTLTSDGAEGLFDPSTFSKLAGPDLRLDPTEVRRALEADVPESRRRLLPKVAEHASILTTSFDMVDPSHREASRALVDWIVENHKPGRPLHVTVICSANSRRSIMGATMGNVAAAYAGLPEIRFHCGGTAISALNSRAIAALKDAGVEVEPTGREAPRGDSRTANPIYKVRWGYPPTTSGDPALETTEFSKLYGDKANPQADFAALMVCGDSDDNCPAIKEAALHVLTPYLDPKIYDGGAYETLKYAERRDDMARLMLMVMTQVRHRLAPNATGP